MPIAQVLHNLPNETRIFDSSSILALVQQPLVHSNCLSLGPLHRAKRFFRRPQYRKSGSMPFQNRSLKPVSSFEDQLLETSRLLWQKYGQNNPLSENIVCPQIPPVSKFCIHYRKVHPRSGRHSLAFHLRLHHHHLHRQKGPRLPQRRKGRKGARIWRWNSRLCWMAQETRRRVPVLVLRFCVRSSPLAFLLLEAGSYRVQILDEYQDVYSRPLRYRSKKEKRILWWYPFQLLPLLLYLLNGDSCTFHRWFPRFAIFCSIVSWKMALSFSEIPMNWSFLCSLRWIAPSG